MRVDELIALLKNEDRGSKVVISTSAGLIEIEGVDTGTIYRDPCDHDFDDFGVIITTEGST